MDFGLPDGNFSGSQEIIKRLGVRKVNSVYGGCLYPNDGSKNDRDNVSNRQFLATFSINRIMKRILLYFVVFFSIYLC